MEKYWPLRLHQPAASPAGPAADDQSADTVATREPEDSYDKARRLRQEAKKSNEGWKNELQRYLDAVDTDDISKDMNTLVWWRVSQISILIHPELIQYQDNSKAYPTLARIALDILPIPATSVGCEHLFSRAKQVATPRRTRLDPGLFEAIESLHYHWKPRLVDHARLNSEDIDIMEDELADYVVMVEADEMLAEVDML